MENNKQTYRILVTGATGYVGSILMPLLAAKGHTLCYVIRDPQKADELQISHLAEQIIATTLPDVWLKASQFKPDVVLHLATYFNITNTPDVITNLNLSNIEFGAQMLAGLSGAGFKYFINTGSFVEFQWGDSTFKPTNYYAATKSAFRHIVDFFEGLYGFSTVTVLPYSVYGGKQPQRKIIDLLVAATTSDVAIRLSPGHQRLDFVHVEDVCSYFITIIDNLSNPLVIGRDWHCGTGIGTSLRELAKMVEQITGKTPNVDWGALPYRPLDSRHSVAPMAKNIEILNWQPQVPIFEGLKKRIANI